MRVGRGAVLEEGERLPFPLMATSSGHCLQI